MPHYGALDAICPETQFRLSHQSATGQEKLALAEVTAPATVRTQIAKFEADGFGHYPVCMAKTRYSFSTYPNAKGAPSGHSIPVREVRLSSGAEFLVAICGDMTTMPGLPRVPAANSIRLNPAGEVEGLF